MAFCTKNQFKMSRKRHLVEQALRYMTILVPLDVGLPEKRAQEGRLSRASATRDHDSELLSLHYDPLNIEVDRRGHLGLGLWLLLSRLRLRSLLGLVERGRRVLVRLFIHRRSRGDRSEGRRRHEDFGCLVVRRDVLDDFGSVDRGLNEGSRNAHSKRFNVMKRKQNDQE